MAPAGTMKYISPLRYPGGKQKLTPLVENILLRNKLNGCHYIEPYAGGAGLALSLLANDKVDHIHINDLNYPLYCFWYSLLNHPEGLLKKLSNAKVTVNAWKRHKTKVSNPQNYSKLDVGFSLLFLNRTNRSGIISGRMIGGYDQTSDWKIDARFYRDTIQSRIEKIYNLRNNIHLYNLDALTFIDKIKTITPPENSLIYLDPPYFVKGQRLYDNHYAPRDHASVEKKIATLQHPWLVSYDDTIEIRDIYKRYKSINYSLNYSAANHIKGTEVMFFSKNIKYSKQLKP